MLNVKSKWFLGGGVVALLSVFSFGIAQGASTNISLSPGDQVHVTCSGNKMTADHSSTVYELRCHGTPATTTTVPPTTTTTTVPPTTTTTTVPPTTTTTIPTSGGAPQTSEHYTANGNFSGSTYTPGADGFNLADVSSNSAAVALPSGVKGLVWLGTCDGATAAFDSNIQTFVGDAKVFGFYLMDEPTPSSCPAANLKAESDYIHANDPGTKTFIIEQNLSSFVNPDYYDGYGPANSDIDLYGIDPYPCRSEYSGSCNYAGINAAVAQAESTKVGTNYYGNTGPEPGIPAADIVPVYQAFGGGTWVDDTGGSYVLPTANQEFEILLTWGSLVPTPVFDYAYSWGSQQDDTALSNSTALQAVFAGHNG